jgi:hypothetical protein
MPRGNSSLEALKARKRLLLLEAEVHRAQWCQEWAALKGSFHHVEEKTRPVRSLLSMAGLFVAGWTAIRQIRRQPGSMFPPLLKLLAGTLLPSFFRLAARPRAR